MSLVVNDDFLQIQKYRKECIYPLKHHKQITESGVQDIATFSVTRVSEEYVSTLVLLLPIKIAPINYDILKQNEARNRKENMHMSLGVSDHKKPLYCQPKRRERSGAGKLPSRVHPKSDRSQRLISCSCTNILI